MSEKASRDALIGGYSRAVNGCRGFQSWTRIPSEATETACLFRPAGRPQRAVMPHRARLAGRDPAKVGHPFTRSVDGTSLVSELQTSHTAPGPQVGHHATVGNSECQG
jgi:hypothetical protein